MKLQKPTDAPSTTDRQFFDEMYRKTPDPWQFATSAYELDRYAAILRSLQVRRFRRAFEPGCSIGVLTKNLAPFCAAVEAIDISPVAVEQARQRCAALPHVAISEGELPRDIPEGGFDLILLVEIGYYFPRPVLQDLVHLLIGKLDHGGVLLAEHWLGHSPDHLLSGDEVNDTVAANRALVHESSQRYENFRMDTWLKM